jgi:hypothetical protein
MRGNAVGTGGPAGEGAEDEAAGVVAGEPSRDDEGAVADELTGGDEFATTADDELAGAPRGELAGAVGPATCEDVDVHALKQ